MQGGSSGNGYGLKYQARCISDVKADTDNTSCLTGTLSLKEENEIHLLRLSCGGSELICEGFCSHPNEIWDLASCSFDQRIFSAGESFGAAIWQIPELYGQLSSPQLERVTSLDAHVGKINCVLWWSSGRCDQLIIMDEQNIFLLSLDCSKKSTEVLSKDSAGMLHSLSGGAWNPHDVNAVAATGESSVQFWDLRTMKKVNSITRVHVRGVDYNPKREHILISAEDESGIHVWDLRKANAPVQELPGHTLWTWALRCNPEYDGLILVKHSAGTDSAVNLWHASVSSSNDKTLESVDESPHQRVNQLLHHTLTMKTVCMALLGAHVILRFLHHYHLTEGLSSNLSSLSFREYRKSVASLCSEPLTLTRPIAILVRKEVVTIVTQCSFDTITVGLHVSIDHLPQIISVPSGLDDYSCRKNVN